MNKIEAFKCDICGKVYTTQDKCIDCENSHLMSYVSSNYSEDQIYPNEIEITFRDGNKRRYVCDIYKNIENTENDIDIWHTRILKKSKSGKYFDYIKNFARYL